MSRILIVDDRPTNRDLVRTVLSSLGHSVVEAHDAAAAFVALGDHAPDLVIADVIMPTMDGYEFVREMRAEPATSKIPVIFYSAHYLADEARPVSDALGVVGVVNKTGDIRMLIEAVDRALGAAPTEPIDIDDDELDRERFRLLNAKLLEKIGELEEKDGVARDLHDIVIQRLFAVGMQLQSLRSHVDEGHRERLDSITAEMDETIGDIRNTIHALKSNDITHDLRVKVQRLIDQTPAILGFRAALHIVGPINTLVPDSAHSDIVATLRESLSNAARHAHASRVTVEVMVSSDEFRMTIVDNGRGLPTGRRESGLANLRARAEGLGGTMTATSGTGSAPGTGIAWTIPLTAGVGARPPDALI
jgi:signal transduction histidine kinase